MKKVRWSAALLAVVFALSLGIGCNVDDPSDNPNPGANTLPTGPDAGTPDAIITDPDVGEPDADVGEPDPDVGQPDADVGQPDADVEEPDADVEEPLEAHQLCAAAGTSRGGDLTAVHCFGPLDISGPEATAGDLTWQPGAFRVLVN